MIRGKIERWYQLLKNRILLENYFLPGDLEAQIAAFVDDDNNRRYHESIGNLIPADTYFGRGHIIPQNENGSNVTLHRRPPCDGAGSGWVPASVQAMVLAPVLEAVRWRELK